MLGKITTRDYRQDGLLNCLCCQMQNQTDNFFFLFSLKKVRRVTIRADYFCCGMIAHKCNTVSDQRALHWSQVTMHEPGFAS